jgi:IBR domain
MSVSPSPASPLLSDDRLSSSSPSSSNSEKSGRAGSGEDQTECDVCLETGFADDDNDNDDDGNDVSPSSSPPSPPPFLFKLSACGHAACRSCLAAQCIKRNKRPAVCFFRDCGAVVSLEDAHAVVCFSSSSASSPRRNKWSDCGAAVPADCRDEEFRRYFNQCAKRSDPHLVECTQCGALCAPQVLSPDGNDTAGGEQVCVCDECSHFFCPVHGDAHPVDAESSGVGRCAEYSASRDTAELRAQEAASMDLIQDSSKPCPSCSAAVELEGGCDHVVCLSCGDDFCFRCGTGEHLTGTVFRACSNCGASYYGLSFSRFHSREFSLSPP